MIDKWFKKGLSLTIILLFIVISFKPLIAEKTVFIEKESDYNNFDFKHAKEYLFQTIIDIANNPEVKQSLNVHKHGLIPRNNNYDFKNAIQKIYSQNPKLLKSIFFTRPKMTLEYLERNYDKGLEFYNILGEEESLNIVESVNIANPKLFNEVKNIVASNKDLSNRLSVLEEMNKDSKSNIGFWDHPVICALLFIIYIPMYLTLSIIFLISTLFYEIFQTLLSLKIYIFSFFLLIFSYLLILLPILFLMHDLGCI